MGRLYCFTHNTDKSPIDVVPVPTIFMRGPHKWLKRKKMGPIVDLREGRREKVLERATKAKEKDEEEVAPFV